ncbi:alpha/beta hydrolase-fold protein [candidate division KSB1 bacterium]
MNSRAKNIFVFILITGFFIVPFPYKDLPAQIKGEDIVVGKKIKMYSKIYGQDIRLSVYLPKNYENSENKYPVLFGIDVYDLHTLGTLDHLSRGQIPKIIYVHIVDYKAGDLSPTKLENRPETGNADRFLAFFKEELIPFIESNYRTEPFRILRCHYMGGLFSLYALLTQPDIFNACIASTPWFIYDKEEKFILKNAGIFLAEKRFKNNFLVMGIGNDPDPGLRESYIEFTKILDENPQEGLRVFHRILDEEDHYSIGHRTLYDGLKWIFKEWREIPQSVLDAGFDGLKSYKETLAEIYGYDIGINQAPLGGYAYRMLSEKQYDKAINVFRYIIQNMEARYFHYEWIARAYENTGQLELALKNFQTAHDMAKEVSTRSLDRIQTSVERVKKKISEK